jgi:transposase
MLDANFMTYERLAQYFSDIFSLPLSEGSINNWRKEFARILGEGYLAKIREVLLCAKYLHADETTINVDGVKEWVHSVCNESATLLQISHSRGKEGITASGVLDKFTGTLIVDGWASYESLPLIKGIQTCFAHLFRYFKDAHESYQQQWALAMLIFLSQFINLTKKLHESGITRYSQKQRAAYYKEYTRILRDGEKELGQFNFNDDHRIWRLLRRLNNDKALVLCFLDDTSLPLTNNMAERSVRPLKVKQKISGTMLSMENAQENLDIKSFVATSKKQGQNVLDAMLKLFQNPHDFDIRATV